MIELKYWATRSWKSDQSKWVLRKRVQILTFVFVISMYGKISRLTIKIIETKYTISKPIEGKMVGGKTNPFQTIFLKMRKGNLKKRQQIT